MKPNGEHDGYIMKKNKIVIKLLGVVTCIAYAVNTFGGCLDPQCYVPNHINPVAAASCGCSSDGCDPLESVTPFGGYDDTKLDCSGSMDVKYGSPINYYDTALCMPETDWSGMMDCILALGGSLTGVPVMCVMGDVYGCWAAIIAAGGATYSNCKWCHVNVCTSKDSEVMHWTATPSVPTGGQCPPPYAFQTPSNVGLLM